MEGAKRYAGEHDTTLTRLVSEYLRQLATKSDPLPHAPIVQRLSGTLSQDVSVQDYEAYVEKNTVAKLRILIDLNVVLDTLQGWEPFYATSTHVLAHVEAGSVEGLVAAHTLTTLFYLLAKSHSANRARVVMNEMLRFLAVAPVDRTVIEQALALPYRDFEDAVQMMAAAHAGAHYVVTRNVKDFDLGPLPVLQPAELLALL